MAKIGETTHYPDVKLRKCCQCGKWFYYDRVTKTTCSGACRKAKSRGDEPTDNNPHYLSDYEQLAILLDTHNKRAYRKLERIKAAYGDKGVRMALDLLMAFCD